ncbi:EFR3-like family protein [Ancylostoma caninum]|uniref:EFR3-like family protein n=1 Tax=Ancylostoma caninum TaxID=29170 RepID=A0A368GUG5_ANCCA|nr:EFR3-like family protein [Ancylostoma caninum]
MRQRRLPMDSLQDFPMFRTAKTLGNEKAKTIVITEYRRLVDSIYPRSITDGLISSNMQKLIFYAISHPEKLERIGEYLVLRMSRDLGRLRVMDSGTVQIAVEAMDQLLQSCHSSPSLPQFSENHLKMVQKLLESNNPKMEQLATDSFVTFSNIEESSPSYHRQYDFFISKFSQMCHASYGEEPRKIRIAGLKGLRGVVWKSVTDDLHPNIWEKQHMDKIVPSILFNLQEADQIDEPTKSTVLFDGPFTDDPNREESPRTLSDRCLRELMGKASFGSLRAVMEPVLKHMDLHAHWKPPPIFAIHVFRAIIYSIQSQNSYFVIQELINHLDSMSSADAVIRIGIATVLSNIVSIAGTSIGPLLLSIFNSLLKHLRTSVDFERSEKCKDSEAEKMYQEALINAMGDFANALPDYQKVEMMMFTVGNIPNLGEKRVKQGDEFLQHVLVKTLLKVATKYRTAYLATVFTDSFLHTLIQLALVNDPQVRLGTQQIFHTLLDRHDNLSHLAHLPYVLDVSDVQLTVEKCSRADQMFMRKHIHDMTHMLYKAVILVVDDANMQQHMDAIQCTMSLLCIEVGFDETLIELFRLAFALQSLALDPLQSFTADKRIALHNLVAKYMNLAAQLMANPSLCQHVQQVVACRAQRGPPGLNLLLDKEQDQVQIIGDSIEEVERVELGALTETNGMLFDRNDVADCLKAAGKDVTRLSQPFNVTASKSADQMETEEADGRSSPALPMAGIDDVSVDLSVDWTPPGSTRQSRRNTVFSISTSNLKVNGTGLPLTVAALRQYANSPPDVAEEEKKERAHTEKVVTSLRSRAFEDQADESCARHEQGDLSRTVSRLLARNADSVRMANIGRPAKPKNIFEMNLPSAFAY